MNYIEEDGCKNENQIFDQIEKKNKTVLHISEDV